MDRASHMEIVLVIYVSQWERLTILCVSGTSSSPSSSPALSSNSGRLKAFIMLLGAVGHHPDNVSL